MRAVTSTRNWLPILALAGLPAAASGGVYEETVAPFLKQHCSACHNSQAQTAGVSLDYADEAAALEHPYVWEDVKRMIARGSMPPAGLPRPDAAGVEAVIAWVDASLERAKANWEPEPGRVTARRLNRTEYNNTIRDIFGVDLRPADEFPVDDSGYGFDNIGDVLTVSPALMEKYLVAAGKVARAVVVTDRTPPAPAVRRFTAPRGEGEVKTIGGEGEIAYSPEGRLAVTYRFPATGEYELDLNYVDRRRVPPPPDPWMHEIPKAIEIFSKSDAPVVTERVVRDQLGLDRRQAREMVSRNDGRRAGDEWEAPREKFVSRLNDRWGFLKHQINEPPPPPPPALPVELRLDGKLLKSYLADRDDSTPGAEPFTMRLEAGEHRFEAEILSPQGERWNPNARDWAQYRAATTVLASRMVFVDSLEVKGPYNAEPPPLPESHLRIVECNPAGPAEQDRCAKIILSKLARRAYRRPATPEEVEKLAEFVRLARDAGAPFEEGLQTAIQAMLVSPRFLFRIEEDPAEGEDVRDLGDYELASRLSYFLWSSTPDDALLSAAGRGELTTRAGLRAQVSRMLGDPKASALIENFAGQWLQLRNLDRATPDPELFPAFNKVLARDMRRETELFFESLLRENRSVLDFLDAKYTFLNERLARHYGIDGVEGPEFRRVAVDGNKRGGILSQASVLTVAAYPTRTSPVLRGLWVMETILNSPAPPPPPNVPELDETQVGLTGSLRQQLEQHRTNPSCAVCHNRIDPLGFGLENYDPVGRWRDRDGNFAVDASGELPSGERFESPGELKALLRNSEGDQFVSGLIEKMLTFALGRGVERKDSAVVEAIRAEMADNDYRFSSLIEGIVDSVAFRQRGGEETTSDD